MPWCLPWREGASLLTRHVGCVPSERFTCQVVKARRATAIAAFFSQDEAGREVEEVSEAQKGLRCNRVPQLQGFAVSCEQTQCPSHYQVCASAGLPAPSPGSFPNHPFFSLSGDQCGLKGEE